MKKQVLLAISALILVTLACSLFGGSGKDVGTPGEPGNAPSSAPATEAPVASQDSGAGPETIDLSNPDLYAMGSYPAYKLDMKLSYDGVDTSGSPKSFNLSFYIENQTEPKAQRIVVTGEGVEEGFETVVLGDQMMSVFPGVGCTVFPASSMDEDPVDSAPDISELLTGQANRIETGVSVEGILTDRYRITSENMTNADDSETPKITDGSVYVARDGGYIVRFEMSGTVNTPENEFDPNTETQVAMDYTFIPFEDGSLVISPPTECADQLAGGSNYPVMDGASDLTSMQDMVFYTVDASLEEVQDFYRTKMVEEGWTLTKDVGGGTISFATLEFPKDGVTVEVGAVTTGDGVAVNITKK